ncbi:hypothetical protein N7517_002173 [Penicillium concentricum]|uniref:Uncharacterized protein n=1 Tax=Penicillium concentricum TaxID=293559 RepID=A0A9W9STI9_9EURO|nr:uncharacterized protein N7517_002173 [Penicillium concentricum]KAJ5384262.1 hypothetical protein N7517_002173 [Penicillium concentricum]
MKFTLISSVLFLATAAIASPDGPDVNSIVSDVEGVYSTAVGGGQSLGSEIASKATSLGEAASTAGAGVISSAKSEASSLGSAAASEASSIASQVTSRVVTAVSAQTTQTDSDGNPTATQSTTIISTSTGSPSGSASVTDNAAFARPTAVGAVAAGMAGILGVMVAL